MTWQDVLNGGFEFTAGSLVWLSVKKLIKDKKVSGISLTAQSFFAFWSWWNLYYYPHLDQWVSFVAGFMIGAANLMWIILALYYTRKIYECK